MVTKGALISFAGGFIGPIPDIIVFQYNPAELSRSLSQKRVAPCGGGDPTQAEPFRIDGPPNETITIKAEFNGDDMAMDGNPITPLVGVRPALGALELLLYSKGEQALSSILRSPGSLTTPPDELPLVIFAWGPGRVLPVRLTALTVREQEFDRLLNPIRAEVDLSLEVLKRLPMDHVARGIYDYTEKQMRVVARMQMINNVQSLLSGVLP
ncbi:MAG: hypothetical protein QM757_23700 [Paludibaculum sp.]